MKRVVRAFCGLFLFLFILSYAHSTAWANNYSTSDNLQQIISFVLEMDSFAPAPPPIPRDTYRIIMPLGWAADYPEWEDAIKFHFLTRLVEISFRQKNGTNKVIEVEFHRLWLAPIIGTFKGDRRFKGFNREDNFFERQSFKIILVDDQVVDIQGMIYNRFYNNDAIENDDVVSDKLLSPAASQEMLQAEMDWWLNFINQVKTR